jgi:hypothetical protein
MARISGRLSLVGEREYENNENGDDRTFERESALTKSNREIECRC